MSDKHLFPATIDEAIKLATAITAIAAAAGTSCLILSALHEFSFYFSTDTSFISLLTASDLIKQAIYWLPLVAICLFLLIWVEMHDAKMIDDLVCSAGSEEEKSSIKITYANFKNVQSWVLLALAIFSGIPFIIGLPWPAVTFLIVAMYFLWSKKTIKKINSLFSEKVRMIVIILIIMLYIPIAFGIVEGSSAQLPNPLMPRKKINLKLGGHRKKAVALLRYIDKGIIVADEKNLRFYPWSKIDSVEVESAPSRSISDLFKR